MNSAPIRIEAAFFIHYYHYTGWAETHTPLDCAGLARVLAIQGLTGFGTVRNELASKAVLFLSPRATEDDTSLRVPDRYTPS